MSISVGSFFHPYSSFLQGAAYNLCQILDGLGVVSSSFIERNSTGEIIGGYWSPEEASVITLGYLVMLSLLLIPLMASAAYTVSRKRGVIIFFMLLCLPGVMNCFGMLPSINYLPARYTVHGLGTLGSAIGLIPLLMICTTAGWATMVLAYDNLNLTDRFRHIYDHFWFPLALVAAVFFVADNGAREDTGMFAEELASIRSSSSYLLSQIRRYDDYCKANGIEQMKSCRWSRDSQWLFTQIKEGGAVYFLDFVPNDSKGFYAAGRGKISDEDVLTIRKEISEYNQRLCPIRYLSNDISQSAPLSSICEYVPYSRCLAKPDGPPGLVADGILNHTVALASECIIPRLAASKPSLRDISELVNQHAQAKNNRWLYFLAVAVAVGAKVALATTKLCLMDTRLSEERRRVLRAVRHRLRQFVRAIKWLLIVAGQWIWFAVIRISKRIRRT
ncbi:hypothetical protein ACA40_08925 [Pseudomonas syringae pv. lapsa]|nr:hypothetical protein [Pseudomonas syringae]ALU59968.1 hypothetical protein ACA40_08925 [Pseudomonas syringae pv. lapsa]QVI72161.1 hypothetical protein KHW12_08630 [Pseudomonas syringae]